jgi:hypothetical protein
LLHEAGVPAAVVQSLIGLPNASQNSRTDPRPESRWLASNLRWKWVARKFKHDTFSGSVTIPGHENDDAKPYLEKQVRNAVKGKAHERK